MADPTPNYITPDGYDKLTAELDHLLRVERPKVVREVTDAAAQGDRSENAEYIYGKRRLREIDRRMNFLASRLKNVQVIDPSKQSGERIFFGAKVTLESEDGAVSQYRIVGVDEVEADAGRISWKSPLGRALLKKRIGDSVTVQRPGGATLEYEITDVQYGA